MMDEAGVLNAQEDSVTGKESVPAVAFDEETLGEVARELGKVEEEDEEDDSESGEEEEVKEEKRERRKSRETRFSFALETAEKEEKGEEERETSPDHGRGNGPDLEISVTAEESPHERTPALDFALPTLDLGQTGQHRVSQQDGPFVLRPQFVETPQVAEVEDQTPVNRPIFESDDQGDSDACSSLAVLDSYGALSDSEGEGESWKQCIAKVLDRPESSTLSMVVHFVTLCLIFTSIVLTSIETMPDLRIYGQFFSWLELCLTSLFTLEFFLRWCTSESNRAFCNNTFNIIDFLAVAPGYIELAFWLNTTDQSEQQIHKAASSMRTLRIARIFRLIRVVRVIRIAKAWPCTQQLKLLIRVMGKETGLYAVALMLGGLVVMSSSVMYLFESPRCLDQADGFNRHDPTPFERCAYRSRFDTIPTAFWWSIVTLTTVGYGDMVPVTGLGKAAGGLTALSGVVVLATVAAMISIHFRESYHQEKLRAPTRMRHPNLGESSGSKQQLEEIDAEVVKFQLCLEKLMDKVTLLAMRSDSACASPTTMPMLRAMREHSTALSSELYAFVHEALHEVVRRSDDLCARSLSRRGSLRRPSLSSVHSFR